MWGQTTAYDFTAKAAQSEMRLGGNREAFDRAVVGFQFCNANDVKPPDDRLETVLAEATIELIDSAKRAEEADKVAQSAELLEAVAEGVGRSLGLTHQNYIAVLSSWAGLLIRTNQLEKALYVCEKAFECAQRGQPQNEALLRGLAANRRNVKDKLDAARR
jgi:hypothetical protein